MKILYIIILIVLSHLYCYSNNNYVEQYFDTNMSEIGTMFYVINDNELIESGVNSVVLGGKYMLFLWVVQELMQKEFSSNILTKSSFDVIKIWYKLNCAKITSEMIYRAEKLFLKEVNLILTIGEWGNENCEYMKDYIEKREKFREMLDKLGITKYNQIKWENVYSK